MNIRIFPSVARGCVSAPPSKSMAHRYLICAALAKGESRICGISDCEDVCATLDCLKALGTECKIDNDAVIIKGVDVSQSAGTLIPCRESGSTMRFLLPLCLLSGNPNTLIGAPSLLCRPMQPFQALCREHGLYFEQDEKKIIVKGPLTAGEYTLPGDVSSQFVSGILFALTQVDGESILRIFPPIESRSYIDMTLDALQTFDADVAWLDDLTLRICGRKPMIAKDVTVEGDYSNAAFLSALNVLGGQVCVNGLDPVSKQGDRIYFEHFEALKKGFATVSLSNCPDLAPILFALAARGRGGCFTDTRRLAIKESNRAEAMAAELRKFGTTVDVRENEVTIKPTAFHEPNEPLFGHNDHRIVMALAVLATETGGVIEGAQAVAKSFPDFFEFLNALGIKTQEI